MELRQLRYFVKVVEVGSISRAALDLDLVQSALSQQITRLEGELSTRLLKRSPQGVTPTEAGGVGASGAFLLGVLRGKLDRAGILEALLSATRTAAAVFTVLIGALIFGYFLTITQVPQKLTGFLTEMGLGRYEVLALIMVMYLILGCLMDAMAMIILTVPIIFPVIVQLGFDPIWFGIIIVMTVELGLIHPPVGMNVFVIKSVVPDVSFTTIFKGVIPFILTDLLRLVILIAFPVIALWLPAQMA